MNPLKLYAKMCMCNMCIFLGRGPSFFPKGIHKKSKTLKKIKNHSYTHFSVVLLPPLFLLPLPPNKSPTPKSSLTVIGSDCLKAFGTQELSQH